MASLYRILAGLKIFRLQLDYTIESVRYSKVFGLAIVASKLLRNF